LRVGKESNQKILLLKTGHKKYVVLNLL